VYSFLSVASEDELPICLQSKSFGLRFGMDTLPRQLKGLRIPGCPEAGVRDA
jgi:hypothetical protein